MSETVTVGPTVIPLKETLARRLSASMDCIDAASGDKDEKLVAATATTAATATGTSESQLDVNEQGTVRP